MLYVVIYSTYEISHSVLVAEESAGFAKAYEC